MTFHLPSALLSRPTMPNCFHENVQVLLKGDLRIITPLPKFRSLFSFLRAQRPHNLLSTARRATKLHCCSANRLVLVDGSTRCEVCLSAGAARRLSGNSIPPAGLERSREDKREQEKQKARTASSFRRLPLSPPFFFSFFLWLVSEREREEGGERALNLLSRDCLRLSA